MKGHELQVDNGTTGELVAARAGSYIEVYGFQAIKTAAGTANCIFRTDGASGTIIYYGTATGDDADPPRSAGGGKYVFRCAEGENLYFAGTSVTISALRYRYIPNDATF